MAVMKTLKSAKAGLVLNGGTNADGSTIRKSMTLGNIKGTATDDAVYNLGAGLAPCLKYPTLEVNRSESYALEL
ncbi:MAG: DUF1659 domain-containing protein, partial [Fretibacterium sp.]|nr:DUF1659 domain-containing protein [Fretibacterium sp.]